MTELFGVRIALVDRPPPRRPPNLLSMNTTRRIPLERGASPKDHLLGCAVRARTLMLTPHFAP